MRRRGVHAIPGDSLRHDKGRSEASGAHVLLRPSVGVSEGERNRYSLSSSDESS
jgi:hypothetical protein